MVELAQLNRDRPQRLRDALHSVYDGAVYLEPLGAKPTDTFHIVGNRLVRDILAPQHAAPQGITDYHQSEPSVPVGRIHLYGHLLILGDLLDIPHTLQVTADRLFVHAVLRGQLFQRLLALHIVRYHLGFISANPSVKTASTGLAFIPLRAASHAIADHIRRPTKKALGCPEKLGLQKEKRMKTLKDSVSTRTKVKVIRAIESGIRMQSVAETMGLSQRQ